MSLTITGSMRNTVRLAGAADALRADIQMALREAEQAGRKVIEEQTPKDTRALLLSAYSHTNQFVVIFGIAGTIGGKPYGFAQEFGWHQRTLGGTRFIEGHHMIRDAGRAAAATFRAEMGGSAGIGGVASVDFTEGVDLAEFQRGLAPVARGSLGYYVENLG